MLGGGFNGGFSRFGGGGQPQPMPVRPIAPYQPVSPFGGAVGPSQPFAPQMPMSPQNGGFGSPGIGDPRAPMPSMLQPYGFGGGGGFGGFGGFGGSPFGAGRMMNLSSLGGF